MIQSETKAYIMGLLNHRKKLLTSDKSLLEANKYELVFVNRAILELKGDSRLKPRKCSQA